MLYIKMIKIYGHRFSRAKEIALTIQGDLPDGVKLKHDISSGKGVSIDTDPVRAEPWSEGQSQIKIIVTGRHASSKFLAEIFVGVLSKIRPPLQKTTMLVVNDTTKGKPVISSRVID